MLPVEILALESGVKRFGEGYWKDILQTYSKDFHESRSSTSYVTRPRRLATCGGTAARTAASSWARVTAIDGAHSKHKRYGGTLRRCWHCRRSRRRSKG